MKFSLSSWDQEPFERINRPCAEFFVRSVDHDTLASLAACFKHPTQVISDYTAADEAGPKPDADAVVQLLTRRPCTLEEIASLFGTNRNHVGKLLVALIGSDRVRTIQQNGLTYFARSCDPSGISRAR